jgi:hypothetical protein
MIDQGKAVKQTVQEFVLWSAPSKQMDRTWPIKDINVFWGYPQWVDLCHKRMASDSK